MTQPLIMSRSLNSLIRSICRAAPHHESKCHPIARHIASFRNRSTKTKRHDAHSSVYPSHQRSLQRSSSSQTRPSEPNPTLFSLPNLSQPTDFLQLARIATEECDVIRKELASSLQTPHDTETPIEESISQAKRTLHQLDDISNLVCTVIDACELCRSVHASAEWRRAAGDAFGMLSEYIGALNADERLYLSLRRWVFHDIQDGAGSESSSFNGGQDGNRGVMRHLSPEYQRMAYAMRREFERDGIHLSYNQREEARELNNVIVGLESLFSANITEKTKVYDVTGESMVGEVDRIVPRHILGQLVRSTNGQVTMNSTRSSLTLSTDALLTNTLLAHSPSPQLRKEVYMQSNTSIPENLNVLDSLIRHRHLHSTLLGYKSYAHRVLSDRMVGCPEKVEEFLSSMEKRCRGVYENDMEVLLKAKRYVEGSATDIEPWDVPFYTSFVKSQRQHLRWKEDSNWTDGDDEHESSQFSGYFTLENSIEGMKVLVKDLFGIEMVEANIPIQERWDVDLAKSPEGSDPIVSIGGGGLRKFVFHHQEEGPLGTMYFDMHPREGKFVHAAHFTIRCGRIRNNDETSFTSNNHQLPIVALVCNLSPSSSPDPSSATVLSHSEVETLFHEFGHGLHSLLSRTSFQHLSGTRAAMDFVETPSHWMETYARDPSFLSKVLARHYITGLPMSHRRARHLALSHVDFRGVEVQTQIVHSRFDQALFGETPCSPSLGGCTSTEIFGRLHQEAGVPYAMGTHWHSRFGHLVTYGAGYYGYLYAQTFAADIWAKAASTSTSSSSETVRQGGMKIWKEMLIHGGAKDPKEMLVAVLGREPSVDAFFDGMSQK
ncbi:hypothetical protein HJC23_001971 [Cyclotella cryptica]|uniref:Peptidase M3A/M3B catalytic domain-containing protein n=1 Tax=Cyclotella cryptica TaxID=29204 RepID=A0ABD3PNS6_9STRA|eukprot:CCRYP_012934-RA/>CCRYP_012934-RA protein AED:0.05 eAED:0.05 QI:0/-1/0/1/-1/1/1/0/831